MKEKRDFYEVIEVLFERDRRYKPDSYEFVMHGLAFTQKKLRKAGHVSGKELLEGLRLYALELYGPMAKTVLLHWGVKESVDFGNIVFNMIDEKLLSRTPTDSLDDFRDAYDFDTAFKPMLKDIEI